MQIRELLNIRNLHIISLGILMALIPFATQALSYAVILWLASGLLLFVKYYKKNEPALKLKMPAILMLLFYTLVVISTIYSGNKKEAFFDIQVKLSLLIFPLFITLNEKHYNKKNKNILLFIFTVANVIAGIVCISTALYNSLYLDEGKLIFDPFVPGIYADTNTTPPTYFSYTDFSIFKHPAYFSSYLILSFFVLIGFLKNNFYIFKNKNISVAIYVLSLLIILACLYFLQSKAGYVTFFILLGGYSIYWLIKKKKIITGIAIISVITVAAVYSFNNNSRFYYLRKAIDNRHDFFDAVKKHEHNFIIERYGIDRISLWLIANEVANEHFWFGCGAGDVHDELNKKFEEYKIVSFIENKYNAHNQFLETFLAQGFAGLLIMLSWLLLPLFDKRNFRNNNQLVIIFLIIIIINFFFESMLNSVSGVIFAALFYSLLNTRSCIVASDNDSCSVINCNKQAITDKL